MLGYHFVGPTLRDGRPLPPDGEWLVHEGDIILCKSGLHMSEHPFDALQYAPGSTLCRVELENDLISYEDKWCGRRRKIIARIDADHLLRRFAADQALSVKHLWEMPPVVKDYLTTLDPATRPAARAAAWGVSRTAAWDAAAARAAAWDAAAAWNAVWAASRATVWATVWDAARAAAWGVSRATVWDAARDSAMAATRAMVWDAARADFLKRVKIAFEKVISSSDF